MKLVWLTDIHINLVSQRERIAFYQTIPADVSGILITGDIAEADCIVTLLQEMARHIAKPIYFVLGNHDYYRGSVEEVRLQMRDVCQTHPTLFWLGGCDPISLDKNTRLVGIDGWADARNGNYQASPVVLHDSHYIKDYLQIKSLGRLELQKKMQTLADMDAKALSVKLAQAIAAQAKHIIIATHVPPFKEACWHEGKLTNDDYLPFFSSKATGDVLMKIAKANENILFKVFSGHTHDAATVSILPNLIVKVGMAEYTRPSQQGVIDTEVIL